MKILPDLSGVRKWITPVDKIEGIPVVHIKLMHSRSRTLRGIRVCCVGVEDFLVASVISVSYTHL
ncbi:hypothetical protein, partial [Pseudomonas sp. ES3-33]|uniref:hypothetical protein n=1 Tax=Pseudomonas sp. ES3-33 TaxID=1628833 RepID=UPI001F19E9E5